MRLNLLRRHSLKARVTVATLGVFVLVLWGLAGLAMRELRTDLMAQIGQQQISALQLLVATTEDSLHERLRALQTAAQELDATLLNQPHQLQANLNSRPVLAELFSGGLFVLDPAGQRVADTAAQATPFDDNHLHQLYRQMIEQQDHPLIGPITIRANTKTLLLPLAVPIKDQQSRTVGAFVGVMDLVQPGFLDVISNGHYGHSGGYLLIDTVQRRIIAASDPTRRFELLPSEGVYPLIDRFLQGYSGTEMLRNPHGLEVLTSDQRLALTPWVISVFMPTREAFAPNKDPRPKGRGIQSQNNPICASECSF